MARLTKDVSSRGQKAAHDSVSKALAKTLIIPSHEFVQLVAKVLLPAPPFYFYFLFWYNMRWDES